MIDNLLNLLRINNIFGANSQPIPPMMSNPNPAPNIDPSQQSDNDIISRIQSMYPMQHDASDRLESVLDQMPQRADYAPSPFTKLRASLATFGGPLDVVGGQPIGYKRMNPVEAEKAKSNIEDEKYNKAVSDWSLKLKPLGELATAERGENSNMRITANNMMQNDIRNRDLARKTEADEKKDENTKAALKEKYAFLDYLQYKQAHPNNIYKTDNNGHVYSINPQTNETSYVVDRDGDLISSDKMPEMEKIKINQANALTRITAQGNETRKTENVREGNRQEDIKSRSEQTKQNIETRGTETRKTNEAKPKASTSKSEKRVRVYNDKGEPGDIPESQLPLAIKQGYTVR